MAETKLEIESEVVLAPPHRTSWGAIFAGTVTSLSIWILLYSLGLALGLSSVDTDNPGSLRSSGLFTGIWGVLAPLIALFFGGWVTARGAGVVSKPGGAMHGLVMWGVTTVVGLWAVMNLLSAVVGGAADVGKAAAQAGGATLGAAVGNADQAGKALQSMGLNSEDALAPINQKLRTEGKPEITADQLGAATREVIQTAVREGKLDKETLVSSIAQRTALSRPDAEQIASNLEGQFNQAKQRMGQSLSGAAQSVQQGALKAAEASGHAFWGIFAALFLGMVAAIGGAVVGVSKRQQLWARKQVASINRGSPVGSGREAYP